jgi:hypothetical protein
MRAKGHTLQHRRKKEWHFVAPSVKAQAIFAFFLFTVLDLKIGTKRNKNITN